MGIEFGATPSPALPTRGRVSAVHMAWRSTKTPLYTLPLAGRAGEGEAPSDNPLEFHP
jgi:hypothetical protein